MGCGASRSTAKGSTVVAGYTEESKVVTGHNESANLTQESPAIDEEEEHHDADKHMWNHINAKIKPTMLKPGQIKEVIIVGAGASGLMCAMALKKKGVAVTIVEGRPRHGGRLYTDPDGLDIGGHWIHGGGPDDEVAAYSAAEIDKFELNPVRGLCDELGIATKLTDGDSCYIGESEAGVREIAFYLPDGSPLADDGPEEEELWDVYDLVIDQVHALEDEMRASGQGEGGMSLGDAIDKVVSSRLEAPLTERQKLFLQWHLETEFGGDYAEDAKNLSFFHYDGGADGAYRAFPGGDRILVGGYSVLIHKMVEIVGPDTIKCDRAVAAIDRSSDGVAVRCVNGEVFTADAAVITVPLGILKRTAGEAGHVAFSPPLPESKLGAIGRGRMSCLNKLFLIFDECHWPKDQYSFAYINETPDALPSMLVNVWPSHGLPILTCLVGGDAGRAMERRTPEENVAWAMTLIRKLFGAAVPEPTRSVQTEWDADPFSYGAYSCAGKGVLADDATTLGAPVDGQLFFAGEHTNPMFWGCVHGALVSGLREAARITGDATLLKGGGAAAASGAAMLSKTKRGAHKQAVKNKLATVKAKKARSA